MSEWIIRVRDNDRRNMKLSQAEFIDLGSLSKESTCSAAAQGVRKGSNSLVHWLPETWTKRLFTVSLMWRKGFEDLGRLECWRRFVI